MKLFDIVRPVGDQQEAGISRESQGVIVNVLDIEEGVFEVEFSDGEGRTLAQLALKREDLESLKGG